jgi:hypothetical protein
MHWITMKIPMVKTLIPMTLPIQCTVGLEAHAVQVVSLQL